MLIGRRGACAQGHRHELWSAGSLHRKLQLGPRRTFRELIIVVHAFHRFAVDRSDQVTGLQTAGFCRAWRTFVTRTPLPCSFSSSSSAQIAAAGGRRRSRARIGSSGGRRARPSLESLLDLVQKLWPTAV